MLRLLAVLALGVIIGAGAVGVALYLSSGDGDGSTTTEAVYTFEGSEAWEARRAVGTKGSIKADEDSQCALATNPDIPRELIICTAQGEYHCYEPDPEHSRDDSRWWTELPNGWEADAGETTDCVNARDALVYDAMLPPAA